MLLQHLFSHFSLVSVSLICLSGLFAHLVYNKFCTGLNHIPGPFWASCTDFYRLYIVWGRRPEQWHVRLHQRYGVWVRIGPKTVICSDNRAAKKIYALNAGFAKSEFYPVQQALAKGVPLKTLFTSTDEAFHAKLRRAVNNAYAMSSLVQFEPFVDSAIEEFLKQLHVRYADRPGDSGTCDLGDWLQYFAFDVICELTYSKRLGFMERGNDVESIISNLQWLLNYAAVIGQVPLLDKLFLKNPIRKWMSGLGLTPSAPVAQFAMKRISESKARKEKSTETHTTRGVSSPRDFLSRFQEAYLKDPEFISQERVLALTVANMFAGSDTTAISLRAIFYHLLRNPEKLAKLSAELQKTSSNVKKTSRDLLSWNDIRELPYLGAVINESLRIHPAVGLALERIVPAQGVLIDEVRLPGGTNVGCNAWVLHLDESVWGPRPESWIPERWIEASSFQKVEMRNHLFTFGAGARTCIGKNISYLEMYKLVPAVLREFKIQLASSEKEWKLHNAWFVRQSEFYVRLSSRV